MPQRSRSGRQVKEGAYSTWEMRIAGMYPLALSEMRWPSVPVGDPRAAPLARWGIECRPGWRNLIEELLIRDPAHHA